MTFDKHTWLEKFQARLRNWKQRMLDSGVHSIYAFVATSTLWPVVEAFRQGDFAAMAALGGVLAGVGGNVQGSVLITGNNNVVAPQSLPAKKGI